MSRAFAAVILLASVCVACGDGDDTPKPEPTARSTSGTVAVTPAEGPWRIAFVSDRDGAFHLYLMNEDGSGVERLSDQEVADMPYAVSRDGTQIAASGPNTGETEPVPPLYRFEVEGGASSRLAEIPPSDTELLFPSADWTEDDSEVLVVNSLICYAVPTDGGPARERDVGECANTNVIVEGPAGVAAAITGDSLVLVDDLSDPQPRRIDTVLPADAGDNELVGLGLIALQAFGLWRPLWSPDGAQIAYLDLDAQGSEGGLSVISSQGGTARLLVADDEEVLVPGAWSSDGTTVIFSGTDEGSSIRAIDVDTGAIRTLLGGDGFTYLYPRVVVEAEAPDRAGAGGDAPTPVVEAPDLASVGGRLIYEGGDGRQGFYSARPDGTDEQQVSPDSDYPSFASPNGRWLSYNEAGAIILLDTRTGDRREFPPGSDPVVSPSGDAFVYWKQITPSTRLFALIHVDAATKRERELYRGETYLYVAGSWSNDGKRIAFFLESPPTRDEANADWELSVIELDDGSLTPLAKLESNLNASGPIAWSPDDSLIAFDDNVLRVVSADDGRPIRDYTLQADAVSWSPHGSRLAVHGGGLFIVDPQTGDSTRLTSDMGGAVEYPPAWSPDGEWLAYVGLDDTLRVAHVDSGTIVRLSLVGDEVRWAND
jgi:Tol biopolymer transport system component